MGVPVPNERLETPLPHLVNYLEAHPLPTAEEVGSYGPHEREIVLDPRTGLIDPSALIEYMDGPHCHELSSPRDHESCKLEYHHLYFSAPFYNKNGGPRRQLRNARYNQILIHSCQEDLYHQTTQENVPLPGDEAIEEFFKESRLLDEYALISGGLAISRQKAERIKRNGTKAKLSRQLARIAIGEEMIDEAESKLEKVAAIHPAVLNGALVGYSNQVPEDNILHLIKSRLEDHPRYLIPRIHSEAHIQNQSGHVLERRIKSLSWTLRLLVTEPEPVTA